MNGGVKTIAWDREVYRLLGYGDRLPQRLWRGPKPRKVYPLRVETSPAGQLRDEVVAALDDIPRSQPVLARRAGMSAHQVREVLRSLAHRGEARRVKGGWVR